MMSNAVVFLKAEAERASKILVSYCMTKGCHKQEANLNGCYHKILKSSIKIRFNYCIQNIRIFL